MSEHTGNGRVGDLLTERPILDKKFDGDKMSLQLCWTDEAKQEIQNQLNDWNHYLSVDNSAMAFSLSDDIIDSILDSMTKEVA